MTFNSSVRGVHITKPTRVSDIDIEAMPWGFYNGVKWSSATGECRRVFKFLEVWRLLNAHPKYIVSTSSVNGMPNKVYVRGDDVLSIEDGAERNHAEDCDSSRQTFKSGVRRPMGRKRANKMGKLEETRQKS